MAIRNLWKRSISALVFLPAVLMTPMAAFSQTYPDKPITIVIPYSVGGTTDIIARSMQPHLQRLLGQPVLVEAKTGGSGLIGTRAVIRAPADGYTILLQTNAIVMTPHVIKQAAINPLKDLEPVSLLANQPMVLVTHPSLPVRSVSELVKYAKAHPGEIDFGSSGVASNGRLATELFMQGADITMHHVPYKGMASITQALVSGEVKLMLSSSSPQISQFVKEGRLNQLGVAALEPSAIFPGLEPIAKTVQGFQAEIWYGLFAPQGTPRNVLSRLEAAAIEVVKLPEVRKAFEATGVGATGLAGSTLRKRMETEYPAWGEIIEKVGVFAD